MRMYMVMEKTGQDRAYFNFINLENHSELLNINVEEKIIDCIVHLRNNKLSSHTIHSRLTTVYHFYTMNDVLLNKVKNNNISFLHNE